MKTYDIAYNPKTKLWYVLEHIGGNDWKTIIDFETEEMAIQFKALLTK